MNPPKPTLSSPPALISTAETCRRLGICRQTLYRMMKAGAIPYVKISPRTFRFDISDIETEARFSNVAMSDAVADPPEARGWVDGETYSEEPEAATQEDPTTSVTAPDEDPAPRVTVAEALSMVAS